MGGQIFPPTRRCMYAALMMSAPSLLEPMYLAEITAPMSVVGGIYSTLSKRRGITQGEYPRPGTPLTVVKAFLPVAESFDSPLRCARTPADRPSLSVCLITGKW